MSHHPPHIVKEDNVTLSPSSFIPFCSLNGDWSVTGVRTPLFSVPVCNIFKEVLLEGELCYQADVNNLREETDKEKIVTEGFMFMLDYNEDKNVEEEEVKDVDKERKSDEQLMDSEILGEMYGNDGDLAPLIYIETIGEHSESVTFQIFNFFARTPEALWRG